MTTMDSIIRNWPIIIFILGMAFVLGGYATMILSLKEQVRILFDKSKSRDEQMNRIDSERAVLNNELSNVKEILKDVKGMVSSIALEIRSGGHVRKTDLDE